MRSSCVAVWLSRQVVHATTSRQLLYSTLDLLLLALALMPPPWSATWLAALAIFTV